MLALCALFYVTFAKIPYGAFYARAQETDTPQTLEQLRQADEKDIAALSTYDSRDYGIVTPVKDQSDSNLCWAYASVAASEVSILRSGIASNATKDNLSLSPEALGYSRYYRPADPFGNTPAVNEQGGADWYYSPGSASDCGSMMSQWCGPVDKAKPANTNPFENALFHLNNAVHISSKQISDVKLAIAKYGAVTFSYNNVRETEYYNPVRESGSAVYPHACTIIGWDDNIPAEKFLPNGASKNGGWLVKNSYTSLPYFWLSYDATTDAAYAFDFTAKDSYGFNYFYDYSLTDHLNFSLNIKKACEIYEAKAGTAEKTEYLKAVNVGFIGKNVTAKVDIYVDMADESNPEQGKRAGGGEAVFDYGGFRTVELDAPVALEKGQRFACVVSVSNDDDSVVICNMLGKTGNNAYTYKNYWQAANNCTPRIKAFSALEQQTEPAPHVHSLVSYGEKSATCTEDGILAHKRCSACGKSFVDGEEKTAEQLKIAATGHRYGEWIDEVAATAFSDGTKGHKDCTACNKHFDVNGNEIFDLVIPKTDEEPKVIIVVENGFIEGVDGNCVTVDKNGKVTVTAAEIEGKTFKGWSADGGKTILSTFFTYTFTATESMTVAAVYEDATVTIPPQPENGLSKGATAGITASSVLLALFVVYAVCYFALYRKGIGLKNKAVDVLYAPMNIIFKNKK